jgi:hypothetical protein
MHKPLVVLAILGTMTVPAMAQTAPATTGQAQPVKPQMVKKRVCEVTEEDSYSRLGGRKICKTIEVPADQAAQTTQKTPSSSAANSGN